MPHPLNNLSRNDRKMTEKAKKNNAKAAISKPEYDEPGISGVASATGATGLMHAPPQNAGELDSYNDLIGVMPEKTPVKNKNKHKK